MKKRAFGSISVRCTKGNLLPAVLKLFLVLPSVLFSDRCPIDHHGSWWLLVPSVLVAALAPNILNLFDLRPGRLSNFSGRDGPFDGKIILVRRT